METEAKTQQRNHVIRKGGYFYRPNAQGYCAHVQDAGRWTFDEAMRMISHMAPGEAHVLHISGFPTTQPQPTPALTPLEEEMLVALRESFAAHKAALATLSGVGVTIGGRVQLIQAAREHAVYAITKAESRIALAERSKQGGAS